jgi:septal ring factor EnvC (AmiA/AmiB activator)
VKGVLDSIPKSVKLRGSLDTIREFTRYSQSLRGRVSMLWNLSRHDPKRRQILYWMLDGSAAMFALVRIVSLVAPQTRFLLQPAFQALVPVASALVAAISKLRPILRRIGDANKKITEAITSAESAQERQIAKLENEVETLQESIDQAEKEQQEHGDAIAALKKELDETDASRLLAEFIKSRADADDYRKHLGMVALVRRDFEHLSDYLRSQREMKKKVRNARTTILSTASFSTSTTWTAARQRLWSTCFRRFISSSRFPFS